MGDGGGTRVPMGGLHPDMVGQYSKQDIEGSWRLRSWRISYDDGRPATEPFGNAPEGLLIYSTDGWMSATVSRAGRPLFPAGGSPRAADEGRVADAYRSYFHYAGPWRIEDDCVIHSVRHSLNPNFVGTEQVRRMRLEGSELILEGVDTAGDTGRRHVLVWQRVTHVNR